MTLLAAARARRGVALALLAAAGLAWWSTAARMGAMSPEPGASLGTIGWFTVTWTVMMAAMMLPSLAPTTAAVAARSRRQGPSPWLLFVTGYLLVWSAAGVLAYGVWTIGRRWLGQDLTWAGGGHWLAGAALALAAMYELTALKRACLTRCRDPLPFLRASAGDGPVADLAGGGHAGVWCLGCSWALMVALFALGVMSLTWMALIAALVVIEKLAPWRRAASTATTLVMLALGVGVAFAADQVPGLVVPGSAAADHAMKAMS